MRRWRGEGAVFFIVPMAYDVGNQAISFPPNPPLSSPKLTIVCKGCSIIMSIQWKFEVKSSLQVTLYAPNFHLLYMAAFFR